MQQELADQVIVRAFVTCWRLYSGVVFAAVTALLLVLVPRGEVAVPGREGVASVIWPLLPSLLAVPLPMVVERRWIDLHATSPRMIRQRLFVLAAIGLLSVAVIGAGAGLGMDVLARNIAALIGLGLIGGALLPRSVSWCLLALAPMVMWLLGTRRDADAYPWAILLRPGSDHSAAAVAVALLVCGAVAFCLPGKRVRGRP